MCRRKLYRKFTILFIVPYSSLLFVTTAALIQIMDTDMLTMFLGMKQKQELSQRSMAGR